MLLVVEVTVSERASAAGLNVSSNVAMVVDSALSGDSGRAPTQRSAGRVLAHPGNEQFEGYYRPMIMVEMEMRTRMFCATRSDEAERSVGELGNDVGVSSADFTLSTNPTSRVVTTEIREYRHTSRGCH